MVAAALALNLLVIVTPAAFAQQSAPRTQGAQLIDRVVAIVNREIITASELARREKQFVANLTQQGVPIPNRLALREQVLERMITDRAMLQTARETGIRVDDVTLDRSIARIADKNVCRLAGCAISWSMRAFHLRRFAKIFARKLFSRDCVSGRSTISCRSPRQKSIPFLQPKASHYRKQKNSKSPRS
ncbi:MAG: SurA N-terminal domain-containing protein [Betaproteobacteria bacterium]